MLLTISALSSEWRKWLSFFLAMALWLGVSTSNAYGETPRDRHVVIIAIDGLNADVFERYAFNGDGSPPANSFLRQLSRPAGDFKSHVNVKMTSAVFPTYTFAGWASVFTGNYPGAHGIEGQNFYIRNDAVHRNYDKAPGVIDLALCDFPDAIEIYGFKMSCFNLRAYIFTAGTINPAFAPTAVYSFLEWLPEPSPWVMIPTPFGPIPWTFDIFDLYASGGIQNGDLLSRTLYDYARDEDLDTYVVHNFYNFSGIDASGRRQGWESLYGGDLRGMDAFWARPSYWENRGYVITDPNDVDILDFGIPARGFPAPSSHPYAGVVEKAIDRVKQNQLPHIMTLYFASVDGDSHSYETLNNYRSALNRRSLDETQLSALRKIDVELGKFAAYLKSRPEFTKTIFMLVADHGHTPGGKDISYEGIPLDKYKVEANGYMAHIYIKNGQTANWVRQPRRSDIQAFLNNLPQYVALEDVELVLVRYPHASTYDAYKWQGGTTYQDVPLSELEQSPHRYMDPEKRIAEINNLNRSGDVILLPKEGIGHTQSTHGSLRFSDSNVPFYVFGEPISKAINRNQPVVFCGASHVDVTPTVLNMFDLYEANKSNFAGKALLDVNLRINFDDYTGCRGSGASDFMLGRWVTGGGLSPDRSKIMLHNPSSVPRDAVVLYYDDSASFTDCAVVRLSAHEQRTLDPPARSGFRNRNIGGLGAVHVRAAPVEKEDRTGGLVGYIRHDRGGASNALTQFILEDQELFCVKPQNATAAERCSCPTLRQMKSPLIDTFCGQQPTGVCK